MFLYGITQVIVQAIIFEVCLYIDMPIDRSDFLPSSWAQYCSVKPYVTILK